MRESRPCTASALFARGKRELERKLPSHHGISIQRVKLRVLRKTQARGDAGGLLYLLAVQGTTAEWLAVCTNPLCFFVERKVLRDILATQFVLFCFFRGEKKKLRIALPGYHGPPSRANVS